VFCSGLKLYWAFSTLTLHHKQAAACTQAGRAGVQACVHTDAPADMNVHKQSRGTPGEGPVPLPDTLLQVWLASVLQRCDHSCCCCCCSSCVHGTWHAATTLAPPKCADAGAAKRAHAATDQTASALADAQQGTPTLPNPAEQSVCGGTHASAASLQSTQIS
jgi:hypothetical protein